jgi:hypothetical protein
MVRIDGHARLASANQYENAVTRFSGRGAPPHPGGIPHMPDAVARDAYNQEVSSAGFWPGSGIVKAPSYYSYAYPPSEDPNPLWHRRS